MDAHGRATRTMYGGVEEPGVAARVGGSTLEVHCALLMCRVGCRMDLCAVGLTRGVVARGGDAADGGAGDPLILLARVMRPLIIEAARVLTRW